MTDLERHGAVVDVSATHIVLRPDLSFAEWEDALRWLGTVARGVQFWVGDALNYGEHAFGEKYAQAIDVTGLSVQTLMNWAWVAANVAPVRRSAELSWSHHLAVAALEPGSQSELLGNARAGGWSSRELKAQVAQVAGKRPGAGVWDEEWCARCNRVVRVREEGVS